MEKYYITDIESGYKYEVTKEEHERYMAAWEYFKPKLSSNIGQAIITGTSGELNNDYQDMLYKPENYERI